MKMFARWIGLLAAVVVIGGALVCTPAVAAPTEYKTRISFRDFKAAYNITKIARLFNPSKGKGTGLDFWIKKFDRFGRPLKTRFIVFRTRTPPGTDPLPFQMYVKSKFGGSNKFAKLSCRLTGSVNGGIRSVKCGGGLTVSPT